MTTKSKNLKRRTQNPDQNLLEILNDPSFLKTFEAQMDQIGEELAAKRKDAVLHLRMNSRDLAKLKEKAARSGLRYQTFIAEILRRIAHQ